MTVGAGRGAAVPPNKGEVVESLEVVTYMAVVAMTGAALLRFVDEIPARCFAEGGPGMAGHAGDFPLRAVTVNACRELPEEGFVGKEVARLFLLVANLPAAHYS